METMACFLIDGNRAPTEPTRQHISAALERGIAALRCSAFGVLAVPSVLLLACATPVAAQDVLAFGLGWGKGTVTCTMCSSNGTYDGVTLNLNCGTTANPHLRVLFDYDEWWHRA